MTYPELRAELEADRYWRDLEIREMQNRASGLPEPEQQRFRRPIVLLLYAHYEGFCKFAFQLYVNAINRERLALSEVTPAVASASIAELISQLSDPNKKSNFFRNTLPEDAKLHRYHRQREFFERFEALQSAAVVIPESAIDLESNLKPVILKKNLYMLGLDPERFASFDGQISQLLKARNDIAHGRSSAGVDVDTYSRLRESSLTIMTGVEREISDALARQQYKRQLAADPAVS